MADITAKPPSPEAHLEDVIQSVAFRAAASPIVRGRSGYVDNKGATSFRLGATIRPKVLVVVECATKAKGREKITVTTAGSQHAPWSSIEPQSGMVPEAWVRDVIVSKVVIPYAVSRHGLRRAVIPVDRAGALEHSPVEKSEFWRTMEGIYEQHRGEGSNTPKTLLARIDYGAQVSAQLAVDKGSRKMVVYPSSGDIMRGARVRPGEAIVDDTLYRYIGTSATEAAYLVGLMNAVCLTDAFSQSRASGRDFHLHPWRAIPIPKFDQKKSDHVALARLAERAERLVESWLSDLEDKGTKLGQVALSTRARKLLRANGISDEIDAVVLCTH